MGRNCHEITILYSFGKSTEKYVGPLLWTNSLLVQETGTYCQNVCLHGITVSYVRNQNGLS